MQDDDQSQLEKTIAQVLRPLTVLMVENGVTIQSAVEILKRTMLDVAETDRDASDSHISLKTGLHRKDVKRLRAQAVKSSPTKTAISPLAAILSHWAHVAPFCSAPGEPAPLPRGGHSDAGFEALVRHSKVDMAAGTVLAELQKQDLVEIDADENVVAKATAYLPRTDAARLAALDATVSDHLRIAIENATSGADDRKSFDRALRYSHLSGASVETLETAARAAALQYLTELNDLAQRLQARDDADAAQHVGRFVSGVYIAPTPPNSEDEDNA